MNQAEIAESGVATAPRLVTEVPGPLRAGTRGV